MPKITFQDLTTMAKSSDANERKRGFGIFIKWVKAAPQLQDNERLTQLERDVLTQMFEQKGLLTAERQKQNDARKRLR